MTTIIYCDDQQKFLDKFLNAHREHFSITTVSDLGELQNSIDKLKKLPDLVLIDLYHPKGDPLTQDERSKAAEESLSILDKVLVDVRKAVLEAWNPTGLEALKLLRKKYPEEALPIAIFTQKGLMLLEPSEIHEAELNGTDWLIKKRLDPITERLFIDRFVMESHHHKAVEAIPRFSGLLIISWLVIGLLGAFLIFRGSLLTDFFGKVAGAAIGAVLAFLVAKYLGAKKD